MALPPLADSAVPGSVVDVPVSLPGPDRPSIQITLDTVRLENTLNYYSETPIAMPHRHRRGRASPGSCRAGPGRHPVLVPTTC